jgi:hypothetical protein
MNSNLARMPKFMGQAVLLDGGQWPIRRAS